MTYNANQLEAFKNVILRLATNSIVTLPTAVEDLLNKSKELVIKNTHYISHRLQGGWKVERQSNSIKLFNTVWYASTEFRRPGSNPRFGTEHNPLPSTIDLFTNNVQAVVMKAMLTGVSK